MNLKNDKLDVKKVLRAKSLMDAGLITKTEACNMLCTSVYLFDKVIAKLGDGIDEVNKK